MNKWSIIGFLAGVLVIAGVAAFFVFVQGAEEPPAAGTPGAPTQVSPPPAQTAERQPAPATAATPATPATPDNGNTRVKLTRTTAETYEPGGEVSVTVRLEKEGDAPVRALGMKEVLPSGWSYQAAEGGEQPDLNRQSGGTVEFAWITVPAFPFEFSYTLRAADGAAGAQTLTGEVLYRLSGPELSSGMVLSEIAPAEGVAAAAPAATPATEPADDPAPTDAPQPAGQPNTPANTPAAATTTEPAADEPGFLGLGRSVAPYTPGQPTTVTVELDYVGADPVRALAVVEELPEGWTYGEVVDGTRPAVARPAPGGGVSFLWTQMPQFPMSFTYEVTPPEDASGEAMFSGEGLWRASGGQERTGAIMSAATPAE